MRAPGWAGVRFHLLNELRFAGAVEAAGERSEGAEVEDDEVGAEPDQEDDDEEGTKAKNCIVNAPDGLFVFVSRAMGK